MTEQNFYEFPKESKIQWEERIRKELKGKNFEESLQSKLWGELTIQPFYTKDDLSREVSQIRFHPASDLPGIAPRHWDNVVAIYPGEEKVSNKEILNALENGAEGLILHLDGSENVNQLLRSVHTEYIQLYILPTGDISLVLNQLNDWLKSIQLKPSMLRGALLWSPTDEFFRETTALDEVLMKVSESIELFREFPDFLPLSIDFAKYLNSGGDGLQQLTYGFGELIELVDHLVKKGVSARTIFEKSAFHLAVGKDYFPEIAKLKAFRTLLIGLSHTFGVPLIAESIHVIVSTGSWDKSLLDKNNNLIRQTFEAMSAIHGGCNTLWVNPAEGKEATVLEARIARNVSAILREESYLDKVMDPAAGSFFIETIALEIEKKVIDQIKILEKNGGWLKSFEERILHGKIRQTRIKKQRDILKNENIKVGVNKYQLEPDSTNHMSIEEKENELLPARASYLAEIQKTNKS
jgi:methylmalonyl-CoA mutase